MVRIGLLDSSRRACARDISAVLTNGCMYVTELRPKKSNRRLIRVEVQAKRHGE